jgi:hypothetical protein
MPVALVLDIDFWMLDYSSVSGRSEPYPMLPQKKIPRSIESKHGVWCLSHEQEVKLNRTKIREN